MRYFRYIAIVILALLAACGGPQSKRESLSHTTPSTQRQGNVGPNDILFRAIGLVGTPYRWGGNDPQSGFDCSGLVVYVFRDVAGIQLPRTVQEISNIDEPAVHRNALVPGDLIFFNTEGRHLSHIGIYVGEGRFVHAPNEGGTVRLDRLDNRYWDAHYDSAKRIPLR